MGGSRETLWQERLTVGRIPPFQYLQRLFPSRSTRVGNQLCTDRSRSLGIVLIPGIALAGCTVLDWTVVVASLQIVAEDQGWVQVRITSISSAGCELGWGDEDSACGVSNVAPGDELYVAESLVI